MDDKNDKFSFATITVIVILGIIGLLAFLYLSSDQTQQNYPPSISNIPTSVSTSDVPKNNGDWDLFLYSTKSPNIDYLISRKEGFSTQEACISEGIALRITGGSYECAYKCEYKEEYLTEKCERTCDEGGCRE